MVCSWLHALCGMCMNMVWRPYSGFIYSLSFVHLCCRPANQPDSSPTTLNESMLYCKGHHSISMVYIYHIHMHISLLVFKYTYFTCPCGKMCDDMSPCGEAKNHTDKSGFDRMKKPKKRIDIFYPDIRSNFVVSLTFSTYFFWRISMWKIAKSRSNRYNEIWISSICFQIEIPISIIRIVEITRSGSAK